jgi:RiboL-PSP-HEPN
MHDPVEAIHAELAEVLGQLRQRGDYSAASALEPNIAKVVVLAAASYFEHIVQACVQDYVHDRASGDELVVNLVQAKAIDRQYHTYFDWDSANANRFFALFGEDFKRYVKERVNSDDQLDDSIRAFVSLGSLRNSLVHQNFIAFAMDGTADDIRDMYVRARRFVQLLPDLLRGFASPGASR